MKTLKLILISVVSIFLVGCPEGDDDVPIIDVPVYLKNISDSTVSIRTFSRTVKSSNDTTVTDLMINHIFENLNSPLTLEPNETIEFYKADRAIYNESFDYGNMNYIFNVDTIMEFNLSKEEVQKYHRGVTKVFLRSKEDYEAINFTIVYPVK